MGKEKEKNASTISYYVTTHKELFDGIRVQARFKNNPRLAGGKSARDPRIKVYQFCGMPIALLCSETG